MIDDEKDRHPFYSDWGLAQHKKRTKELIHEEEETAKRNARKASGNKGPKGVEDDSSREGQPQVRVVRRDSLLKCSPRDREKVQASTLEQDEQSSLMPKVPQIRHRNFRPRESNKGNVIPK